MAEEQAVSQRLIEAALAGDVVAVSEALANKMVDVNYKGPVSLRVKCTDSVQHDQAADEVKIEYEIFKTDVTPLFAAAHSGHQCITKLLLVAGADVNEKLFKGYAVTAAAREGHHDVVSMLQRSGSCQLALEDALLEACLYEQPKSVGILMASEMIRPDVAAQALAHASSRGFVTVVEVLVENGADVNSWHRMLLRSTKPSLHANVNCTPLVAAVVGRQVPVVRYLLEAGVRIGCKSTLGAWAWESGSLDEVRVGAGLGSPYNELWCAVEYWEATGTILDLLLEFFSSNDELMGRTVLCHAILCRNISAVEMLLKAGANAEEGVRTGDGEEFPPILITVKYGCLPMMEVLTAYGCDLNASGPRGETALMIAAKLGFGECFEHLLQNGADLGIENEDGLSAVSMAEVNGNGPTVTRVIWKLLRSGARILSSDLHAFSELHFVAKGGDVEVLDRLLQQPDTDINTQDQYGYTPLMVATQAGHIDVLKLLVHARADISVKNKKGETAVMLAKYSGCLEQLEKILLEAILCKLMKAENFKPLHFAAWRGNTEAVVQLLTQDYAVDAIDEEGYTPLMLAAREGHAEVCKVLLNSGADCQLTNDQGDSALTLAKLSCFRGSAEEVLLDHLAVKLVLTGDQLSKYTRDGRGAPHMKSVRMLSSGYLTWGNSSRRTVECREAGLGGTVSFRKNRKSLGSERPDLFRVITTSGREVHFYGSNPELWVRGITLVSQQAAWNNKSSGRL